jgi:hypothetical protein
MGSEMASDTRTSAQRPNALIRTGLGADAIDRKPSPRFFIRMMNLKPESSCGWPNSTSSCPAPFRT